jgi:uncharacterized membrane protein
MNIDPILWSHLHGAAAHFPVALMAVSAGCDAASLLPVEAGRQRALRSTASVCLVLGALVSYAAVASGLIMARWQVWGHGTLLRHHLFVWPAFVLMTGLAAWRIFRRLSQPARPTALQLALTVLGAVLMSGAGYWGGEVLNHG